MKQVEINKTNLNPNFIGAWILEPPLLCESIINYYELNQIKHKQGTVGGRINLEKKDSIDLTIRPKEIDLPENQFLKEYFEKLLECYKDYVSKWPFVESIAKRLEIGPFNIQRYNTGQHFKKIHTERSSLENLHRVFAFMTYLNDVKEGGSTYFSHYDLDIKPEQGLTLIWPAEWTHAHKGNILKSGTKYIITGWMHLSS